MKTLNQCKKNIQQFANKHKVVFDEEGEVGFGRECVGLKYGDNWIDYNPVKHPDYNYIEKYYDERLYSITPEDAYHKHNCIAVLGRREKAIRQLSDWVDRLKELNVELVEYGTGATGLQIMFSGIIGHAFVPKKK